MGMGRTADEAPRKSARDSAIVVSAYGAYRVLIILLGVWTFFAGMALVTQGVRALSLGSADSMPERVVGFHLLMLVPIYVLLGWRRDEYRLFTWIPYVAQVAILAPYLWGVLIDGHSPQDGLAFVVVSGIFLALLLYVRASSHPLSFFEGDEPDEEEEDEYYEDEEDDLDDDAEQDDESEVEEDEDEDDGSGQASRQSSRGRRYRRN